MAKLQSVWLWVRRHKYFVVTVVFVLLIGFVGDSSVWERIQNYRRITVLENEIAHYTEEYENDTRLLNSLSSNPGNMERIARERYLMKKPNEDIFVFEEDLPKSPITAVVAPAPPPPSVSVKIPLEENSPAPSVTDTVKTVQSSASGVSASTSVSTSAKPSSNSNKKNVR